MRCHEPYPIAYVPLRGFDHQGGPGTFALKPVTLRGHGIGPVPVAQDLAVDVTSTDVDFFQPHLDTAINYAQSRPGSRACLAAGAIAAVRSSGTVGLSVSACAARRLTPPGTRAGQPTLW